MSEYDEQFLRFYAVLRIRMCLFATFVTGSLTFGAYIELVQDAIVVQ